MPATNTVSANSSPHLGKGNYKTMSYNCCRITMRGCEIAERKLTGDTLTIAIFIFGVALAFFIAGLQAVQAKQFKWALMYFPPCIAAVTLGVYVPAIATFLKSSVFDIYAPRPIEPPSTSAILLADYFAVPAMAVACLYSGIKTYWRYRTGRKFNVHLSFAFVAHGVTLAPAVVLCLGLRSTDLATYILQQNPSIFMLCGMFVIVNVLHIPSPDITEEDLA